MENSPPPYPGQVKDNQPNDCQPPYNITSAYNTYAMPPANYNVGAYNPVYPYQPNNNLVNMYPYRPQLVTVNHLALNTG